MEGLRAASAETATGTLSELRRLRNSLEVVNDMGRLTSVTQAIESAMEAAYEDGNDTDASCANKAGAAPAGGDTVDANSSGMCLRGGISGSRRRPGNFHGVKSHTYYVGAISEAHPSLPYDAVQSIVASEWYHPGLTAKAVWCTEDCGSQFSLARRLDANFDLIRAEVNAFWSHPDAAAELKGVGAHTTQFDRLISGNGTWVDVRLWRGRAFNRRLCERHFRVVCSIVEASPEVWTNPWSHVLLSVLLKDSWVPFHQGHSNGQLTYHLPVSVPAAAGVAELAVVERGGSLEEGGHGKKRRQLLEHPEERAVRWHQGKTLVFDDSFTHAVRYRTLDVGAAMAPPEVEATLGGISADGMPAQALPGARVVLLMRGWHPELAPDEREAIRDFVRRGGEEQPEGYELLPVSKFVFRL